MKKIATLALVGILMAFAVVPASAETVISPQATIVVEGDTKADADSDSNSGSNAGSSTDNSSKSPQTGDFSAAPFVVATLSMAAAAVACKAVKTSKEQ